MLNDSGTEIDEEFLGFFLEESVEVVSHLKNFVKSFKKINDKHFFEKFGQQVDRIMGAAYTLSLTSIGDLSRMGKELGYKSTEVNDIEKLLVIQSLLAQLAKALDKIMKDLKKGKQFDHQEFRPLYERLAKASQDLGNLRTSVSV
jgi:hypothetical protein